MRKERLICLEDVGRLLIEHLRPGSLLAVGGHVSENQPVALVHQVIRAGVSGLRLTGAPAGGFSLDLLIAAGAVAETLLPAMTVAERTAPAFREWVEAGKLRAHAIDAVSLFAALIAAGARVPFMPVTAVAGSDVSRYNPLLAEATFDGRTVTCVRPLPVDVALIHAQEADVYGNLRITANRPYIDSLIAKAARIVIASADRIVSNDSFRDQPLLTTLPGIYVDAVVHVPGGAHPLASTSQYGVDHAHVRSYLDAVREGRIDGYLQKYVLSVADYSAYRCLVTAERPVSSQERVI